MAWSYEDVKHYIEVDSKTNYKLISNEYFGIHKKLKIRCSNQHDFEMTFGNLKDHDGKCPICSEIQRRLDSYNQFKQDLIKNGYRLLSGFEYYKTKKSKIKVECMNGHKHETDYKNFSKGIRCMKCRKIKQSENQRNPIDKLYIHIESEGFKIIKWIDEYKNLYSKFIVSCSKKHEYETSYGNLKSSKFKCPLCRNIYLSESKRTDGNIVFNAFKDSGCTPMFKPEEYINGHQQLPFICRRHKELGIQYRTYDTVKTKNKPKCCHFADARGENASNWKGGTIQLVEHLRKMLKQWKLDSMEKHNYKCYITGINNRTIEIHHVYNFNKIVLEVLSILNLEVKSELKNYSTIELKSIDDTFLNIHHKYGLGKPMVQKIHTLYHINYGYSDNDKKQFDEFKNNYYNGLYDNELDDELKSYNSIKRFKENGIEINFKEAM